MPRHTVDNLHRNTQKINFRCPESPKSPKFFVCIDNALRYELRVRAFFSTRYSQLVFTVLTVGVESSSYRMGTSGHPQELYHSLNIAAYIADKIPPALSPSQSFRPNGSVMISFQHNETNRAN